MVWKIGKLKVAMSMAGLVLMVLVLLPSSGNAKDPAAQKSYVYVCSCMGTSSCECMTEAKREGPCACGTKGGPPLQRVEANSNWAKANRDALAR